jgi:GNAT superfamily N-acetyltransferase
VTYRVRRAEESDALEVGDVAARAWRDTYAGLLRPETIEAFISASYSPERVERRIQEHHFWVAERDGAIAAFVDVVEHADRVELVAIYALPAVRGRGAGTALLNEVAARFPDKPIVADVLEGNRKGEVFYEHRGFTRRETIESSLFGERVVERRCGDQSRRPLERKPGGERAPRLDV